VSKQVLVVGDAMLDIATHVKVKGISPESQNVLRAEYSWRDYSLGGAANVAANLVNLGLDVKLWYHCGYDNDDLRVFHQLLEAAGIGSWMPGQGAKAGKEAPIGITTKHRTVSADGCILRIDRDVICPSAIDKRIQGALPMPTEKAPSTYIFPPDVGAIVVSDYGKGFVGAWYRRLCGLADYYGTAETGPIPILVDPAKNTAWANYRGATVLKANLPETAIEMVGCGFGSWAPPITSADWRVFGQQVDEAHQRLVAERSFPYLWITLEPDGSVLADEETITHLRPSDRLEVRDVTGAGDVAIAALACYLVEENDRDPESMRVGIRMAQRAAEISVGCQGTHVLTRPELEEALRYVTK